MSFIFFILVSYAITIIIVTGSIFERVRDYFAVNAKILYNLVSCPLCTSTWVGFILSTALILTQNKTPAQLVYDLPIPLVVFLDGMFTTATVWIIYTIIERIWK